MAPRRSKRLSESKTSGAVDNATTGSVPDETEDNARINESGSHNPDDIAEYTLPVKDKTVLCHRYSNQTDEQPSLIFTHGAGGGITDAATTGFAQGYASMSPLVVFQGTISMKSRTTFFQTVLEDTTSVKVLGGRSMGARAAVLTAKNNPGRISAVVLVSFPLVGAKAGDSREDILKAIDADISVLFISGDGDSMCDLQHLDRVRQQMKAKSWLVVVEGANHGMSLKGKNSVEAVRAKTGQIAATWIDSKDDQRTEMNIRWDRDKAEIVADEWRSANHEPTSSKRRKQE